MAGRAAGDRISLHDQVGGAPDLVPIARAPKPDFGTPTHRHPGPPSEALLQSISGGGMGKAEAYRIWGLLPLNSDC